MTFLKNLWTLSKVRWVMILKIFIGPATFLHIPLRPVIKKMKIFRTHQYESLEKEHGKQFLKVPPRFEGEDIEVMSHASASEETLTVSARQGKEEDISSEMETTSCFNFQSICQCFRKWFFSSPLGRKHPEKATQTPTQNPTEHAPKKTSTRKNKRILLQNSVSEDTP